METDNKKTMAEILGYKIPPPDPENLQKEHQKYQTLELAKKEITELVKAGMTWQEVSELVKSRYGSFGKLARSNLRKIAAKIAGCEIPQTDPEIVKSKRGTYGFRVKGNKAYSLSRQECQDRHLTPGPGNVD